MIKKIKFISLILSILLFLSTTALLSFVDDHHSADFEYRHDTLLPQGSLSFSVPPGFYSEPFELEILAPNDEIYYTLDGTDPDRSSYRYTGPILISDATNHPNVHSARTDTSSGFLQEEDPYLPPDYLVDKCTIIRAKYYDKYGNGSDIKTTTYFVRFDDKAEYDNIHVLSIITHPDNLFDYHTGIYVLGNTYYAYGQNDKTRNWYWHNANYRQHGKNWERQATIQLFNEEKKIVLTQDVGLRIQGGVSRSFDRKSLNLYARSIYDGNTRIHYDFWNTGYIPDKLTMSSGGNDYQVKLKDRLLSELLSDLQPATMNYTPCLTFLDGEFWGFYYLTEKYDPAYIQNHYHVDQDNVIMIKHGALDHGEEQDILTFNELMDFFLQSDLSLDENYKTACQYLDMENTLDYLASMIYIARTVDWRLASSNSMLWRARNPGSSPYADCKWRWMIFDLNTAAASKDLVAHDTIQEARSLSIIVDRLCENKHFTEALSRRIIELGKSNFSPERVNEKLNAYMSQLSVVYQAEAKRFGDSESAVHSTFDSTRVFFELRYDHLIKLLKTNFPELDIDAIAAEF